MKKLIETILIKLHERKEARLYNAWAREQENERHAHMISEAEQLASRPAYRPAAENEVILELKKAA